MVFDHHNRQTGAVRSGLSVLVYPIQYLAHLPVRGSEWMVENLSGRNQLLEENKRLKVSMLLLKAKQQTHQAVAQENVRLRALLDSAQKIQERVLVTELLRVDMDPYQHQVKINKGESDGVFNGQATIDAFGVVGQVTQTSPVTANVMLITDLSHATPVQVSRTNLRTIAVGSGRIDQLDLPYLPNNTDIQVGDLLVTSGLGGIFPPGYPVATVVEVTPSPGKGFAKVTAKPKAFLEHSRLLLLVWREAAEDEWDFQETLHTDNFLLEDLDIARPEFDLDLESIQSDTSK